LYGRTIKTRLELVRSIKDEVAKNGNINHKFEIDDKVFFRNYSARGPKWEKGTVVNLLGGSWIEIKNVNGEKMKRHFEQVRPCFLKFDEQSITANNDFMLNDSLNSDTVGENLETSVENVET